MSVAGRHLQGCELNQRTAVVVTALEVALPTWHHQERHSRVIRAAVDAIWYALTQVTTGELTVTRPLMAVRQPGRARQKADRPFLTNGPIQLFSVHIPFYAIGGTISCPWQLNPPRASTR